MDSASIRARLDAEDPIVKTMPVFLNSQLASNLHLFQFPIRSRPFSEGGQPIEARIKSKSQVIELDLPLDTRSVIYDPAQGETFGSSDSAPRTIYDRAADPDSGGGAGSSPKKLDRMTLTSTKVPPITTYYVAAFRDDEMHLSPVASTLQFTPSLKHIDRLAQQDRDAKKRVDEEEKRARGEQVDKKPSAAMLLSRVETEDMASARQKSITHMRKVQDEEKFAPLDYYNEMTDHAEQVLNRMFALYTAEISVRDTPAAYLARLVPPVEIPSMTEDTRRKPGSVSREEMKVMTLDMRIQCLMTNAHILRIEDILRVIPTSTQDEIEAVLRRLCVPVRGLWIVRSNLVYAGREAVARDFLINMFHESRDVLRSNFASTALLDVETTKQLLSDIAVLVRPGTADTFAPFWRLKYTDGSADEPPVHPAYAEFEHTQLQQSMQELGLVQAPKKTAAGGTKGKSASAGLARAASGTASSGASGPALARAPVANAQPVDPVLKSIATVLVEHGVVLESAMLAHLQAEHPDVDNDELQAKVAETCRVLHGSVVLKVRPDTKFEQYRQVVLDLFEKKTSVKKNEVIIAIQKATGQNVPVKAFMEITAELAVQAGPKAPFVWKSVANAESS
ncbi:hypothetical protein H9P43_000924 [Blastocladiella emersonii ATCC 22665]|nr:hypothetical protein H9P43_000924 [Blastocladiella emersonii ATCC 22665]